MEYATSSGRLTPFAFLNCAVAASGGLVFGYDIGVTGWLTSSDSFLKTFFPSTIYMHKHPGKTDDYCKYEHKLLVLFTSSMYLAALVASFFAASVTRALGRKWSMFGGGVAVFSGTVVASAAQGLPVVILDRVLVGIGVGFVLQSVPVYISEIAPARLRGVLNVGFQLMITIGILCGHLVYFAVMKINAGWSWRLGTVISIIPTGIVTLGSLFVPDTPNSLIDRDNHEGAQSLLRHIRGVDDISSEYSNLVAAGEQCKLVKHPWLNILKRKYRGQLIMSILIPFFQQFAGINAMVFYVEPMFSTMAIGENYKHMGSVILGVFNVFGTFVCFLYVDRIGRRKLFLQGGSQMTFCLVMVGTMFAIKYRTGEALSSISQTYAGFVFLFICLFVSAYAYSWGPLGWLVPSEIFPLEIRPIGQSIAVSANMLFTFAVNQMFHTMLCHMKFVLFYFFAVWVLVMTAFVMLFLPETKGVLIEEVMLVWKDHWFWGRFITDDDVRDGSSPSDVTMSNMEAPEVELRSTI